MNWPLLPLYVHVSTSTSFCAIHSSVSFIPPHLHSLTLPPSLPPSFIPHVPPSPSLSLPPSINLSLLPSLPPSIPSSSLPPSPPHKVILAAAKTSSHSTAKCPPQLCCHGNSPSRTSHPTTRSPLTARLTSPMATSPWRSCKSCRRIGVF